jgi:hypothetical protein
MRPAAVAASAVVALTAMFGAPTADTAPAAKAKSPWRLFPGTTVDAGRPLLSLAWAANRVWIVGARGEAAPIASARVSGRTLASFTTGRVPGGSFQYVPIVDDMVVLGPADRPSIAPLLPSGRLGAARAVPEELVASSRQAVPKLATVSIQDGLRVGGRTVWALSGSPDCHSIGGCPGFFVVCCSESGTATDLTRFVDRRVLATTPHLGLDDRGRLWLSWLDRRDYSRAMRGVPRMLQLDASTLAARGNAVAAPGLVTDRVELACAASCRVVTQGASGDIVSWAPGERPTMVVRRLVRTIGYRQEFPRELLAATYTRGGLTVAYRGQTGRNDPVEEIGILRGDGRGARGKVVASVATTYGWPTGKPVPPFSDPVAYGTFVPGGFVALEHFRYADASSPVVYAFVPLGR